MKKNRMKLIAVLLSFCLLLSVIVLLLFCLQLSSCSKNLKNYFYTEESLKRVAAKALKEKYDEEFEIYDAWVESSGMFKVTCSPKNDTNVVFEANVYKDGGGVYEDEYLKGIVDKQVEEKFQEDLQIFFGECLVNAYTFCYDSSSNLKDIGQVTLEDYMNQYEIDFCSVYVFVEPSQTSHDLIESEYGFFADVIQEDINQGRLPTILITMYFVDNEKLDWCKEYFAENSKCRAAFYDVMENDFTITVGFPENKINRTYEEYKTLRMEIATNE